MKKILKWFGIRTGSRIADLDFEIPNKKEVNYSRLILLKELRVDLLQINDIINYHILNTKLIVKSESNDYTERITIPGKFLFWDTSRTEDKTFISKIILKDNDKSSGFFFRVNSFEATDDGLKLSITLYPQDKDELFEQHRDNVDIYEFENLFSNWVNNIKLFNNFKIDSLDSEKIIDGDIFFFTETRDDEKLNFLEIRKVEMFLTDLKASVLSKQNLSNTAKIKRIIVDIDYIKENLPKFSKNKLRFYLNNLGKKVFWFIKEMTFELIKEVLTRNLLGPG